MRTVWKLTESQGSVNFCSLNLNGIVSVPIRVGRYAMPSEVGYGKSEKAKEWGKRWVSPTLHFLYENRGRNLRASWIVRWISFTFRSRISVGIFCLCLTAGLADETEDTGAHLRAIDGSSLNIELIMEAIENLDTHSQDSSLSRIFASASVPDSSAHRALSECGHEDGFKDFFAIHGFETRQLTPVEKTLLSECMRQVFHSMDDVYGFAAPGYYKRFSEQFVGTGIDLAYRCGYRSHRLFVYFSVALWLLGPGDLQSDFRFRCIGDVDSSSRYSEDDFLFGIVAITNELEYLITVLGSWNNVLKYLMYKEVVLKNIAIDSCKFIFQNYNYDDVEFDDLFRKNRCGTIDLDFRQQDREGK